MWVIHSLIHSFFLQKAHDRSWRQVYVVLRSQALLMYKDKKMALEVF